MEDSFFEDCITRMDISETELQSWYELGECDKSLTESEEKEGEVITEEASAESEEKEAEEKSEEQE